MKAGKLLRRLVAGAVLVAGLAVPASAAAGTFTVTNENPSGAGSLRQAVLDANSHRGHDAITFAGSVGPNLTVNSHTLGPVEITSDLEIRGPGSNRLQVINDQHPNDGGRIFNVAKSANATISGLKLLGVVISDGRGDSNLGGGAILNQGSLTVNDVKFDRCQAFGRAGAQSIGGGAIANRRDADLVVRNSNFSSANAVGTAGASVKASGGAILNDKGLVTLHDVRITQGAADTNGNADAEGGAVANIDGDLHIADSSFDGNRAEAAAGQGNGGAIWSSGELIIYGSTFSENGAFGNSADPPHSAAGGALYVESGGNPQAWRFSVENSTITGNFADIDGTDGVGGGIADFRVSRAVHQPAPIVSTTIASNTATLMGANLYLSAWTGPSSSIFADPIGAQNCSIQPGVLKMESHGYNIDSGTSCELNAAGDRSDTDPQLKDLADNGGPTQTMAIPLSSPALDQGVSGGLTTDQRGSKRPVLVPGVPRPAGGDGSDIGAYEFQPGPAGDRRIAGAVRPGNVVKGERTCFDFTAERGSGAPINNAQVRFAGKRRRTDEDGEATLCKTLRKRGERHPRIRKRGYERDRLTVDVSA